MTERVHRFFPGGRLAAPEVEIDVPFIERALSFALVCLAVISIASPAFGQVAIESPAAGGEVGDPFELVVSGPAGSEVAVLVDGEEIARVRLDRNGRSKLRLARPATDAFRVEVQQFDNSDMVGSTSIRLRAGAGSSGGPDDVPPPPPTDGTESNTDEMLPPPPPPPESFEDGPPTGEAPPQTDETPDAPPQVDEPQEQVPQTPDSGMLGGDPTVMNPNAIPPGGGYRFTRILLEGLAGAFAVPTAWFIGIIGLGIATNFGTDDENLFALTFLASGVLGATTSVYLVGDIVDGNGSFWATLLGAAGVTGVTTLSIMGEDNGMGDEQIIFASIFGSLAGIAGAIAGYELTSDTSADYTEATGISDAMISAAPTPDGNGLVIGIVGRF